MYNLNFHPRVAKKLKQLHPNDKKRIVEKIDKLSQNPKDASLDIKKLANTKNSFRLRIGNLRAIFEVAEKEKIVYIWDVDYRGSIY